MTETFVLANVIRARFSGAMSAMYRQEVPAYGTLMTLVDDVNRRTLAADPDLQAGLEATDTLERISDERHGAIRLGRPEELATMRRVFAIMGMQPVGYYDLSEAGIPVSATAFRPVADADLKRNPFRVFTSLLRLDLVRDAELRAEAAEVLSRRSIFTDRALSLVEMAERDGGLRAGDADEFVRELLETFRWHDKAVVSADMYRRLHDAHRLVADVVSFRGPHINHLTPRTLDIDEVQTRMASEGIAPKAFVEGPPTRTCPILLRQTSFKALDEAVSFQAGDGTWIAGSHTARFGEIEQRGIALTPRGRALYDRLLAVARKQVTPLPDGSNASAYEAALAGAFVDFPDDWAHIRHAGLGYFRYSMAFGAGGGSEDAQDIETAIEAGLVRFDPITYEDFLPVSAAGIFQSNLGDGAAEDFAASPNQRDFERDLGAAVLDEFAHYAAIEQASIDDCLRVLRGRASAA